MKGLNPTRTHLIETFGLNINLKQGKGCVLTDDKGKEYLDFLSQYGALPFGQNPTEIWSALKEQQELSRPNMVQPLPALEAERLADSLTDLTPHDLSVVTLANSGAEAVEASIKLARARTGRDVILSTQNGFHGKTLGSLSTTGNSVYQKDFGGPAPNFKYLPFNDLEALEAELSSSQVAAFIVEPIQGEGGVVCPSDDYLDEVISLCRRYGTLSIIDEIQTGLGRTGKLFACEDCKEPPDVLLLGKALGGGLMPISAMVVRPEVWDDRFGLLHSSTFANNNLACTAANATLDLLLKNDKKIIREVERNGRYFKQKLLELQKRYPDEITSVSGQGYMLGVKFVSPLLRGDSASMSFCSLNGGFIALLSSYLLNQHGVLTAPVFNNTQTMRLQPPLVADKKKIDKCVDALDTMCSVLHKGKYSELMKHLVTGETVTKNFNINRGPLKPATEPTLGKFCFVIHYTEKQDILNSDKSLQDYTPEQLDNWTKWVKNVGPGYAWPVKGGTSLTGATTEGMLLSVPLLPNDMVLGGRKQATEMIKGAVDLAIEYGSTRLGLGAFTSIVTNGGKTVTGNGIPVTSGNTLTTVMGVRALEEAAESLGVDISKAHIVVVGATGSIGRLASLILAKRTNKLTLVGNPNNRQADKFLSKVCSDINNNTVNLTATTDLNRALSTADLVFVATNSESALIDTTNLKAGTVVCDVSRPSNVVQTSKALVFDGGLVKPPFPVNLGPFQNTPDNLCWGCLGETMLLALEGETADYSIGRDLTLEDADRISEMALRHGFEPNSSWKDKI